MQQPRYAPKLPTSFTFYYDTYPSDGRLFYTGDRYNFFNKIKRGLFSEFKDILHEDGVIKSMAVARETTKQREHKFFYLFNVVLSEKMPVTALQYACMYSRKDFIILILQYLIGASREYAMNYINYAALVDKQAIPNSSTTETKSHYTNYSFKKNRENFEYKTALDLVGRDAHMTEGNVGLYSALDKVGSAVTKIPKVLANPVAGVGEVASKSAKFVGETVRYVTMNRDSDIIGLLQHFGAKNYNETSNNYPAEIKNLQEVGQHNTYLFDANNQY
jgi:hypothetical protein